MPIPIELFPTINASLNALAFLFLMMGWFAIRRKSTKWHAIFMGLAVVVSALFLASYLTYHFTKPAPVRFMGQGIIRPIYFFILVSHILLAVTVPVFVIQLLRLVAQRRFEAHARLARVAWPIWVYVSITGVMVYLFLYTFNPTA